MQVLTKSEFEARKAFYLIELKKNIFIYPTDTIYGVGCDALNGLLVERIRELKNRYEMPFSVIAPSKDWIRSFCDVGVQGEEWLEKLPGPYTLIFPLKKKEELPYSVNNGEDTIGVRIPNHWISTVVQELKTPIITTSANKTGENHMCDISDLSSEWRNKITYTLYEGELASSPSTIVDLSQKEVVVKKR